MITRMRRGFATLVFAMIISPAFGRMYDPAVGRFLQEDPIGFEGGDTNLYAYVGNSPVNYTDPTGEFINVLVGGGTSIAMGYLISKVTGECYGFKHALIDGAMGSAGVGIFNKIRSSYRLYKLRKIASTAGMIKTASQKNVERYVGSRFLELEIKHVGNPSFSHPETSWIPRARLRIDAGLYEDPFTGSLGPKRSAAAHIPLEALSFSEAPAIGAGQGLADALMRGSCGCK